VVNFVNVVYGNQYVNVGSALAPELDEPDEYDFDQIATTPKVNGWGRVWRFAFGVLKFVAIVVATAVGLTLLGSAWRRLTS